ncbi:RrF2 family transcriptional regulator [Enterococcus olivae]
MRLKNSLEEAICILLILGKNDQGMPIKSSSISQQLGVSDSYLKKVLRKLVIGEMITSSVSKGGGFSLARSLEDIYILDIYYAIEGKDSYIRTKRLTEKVFSQKQEAERVEKKLLGFLQEGEELLLNRLANYSLGDLLREE